MTKKQRAEKAVQILKDYYPDAACSLIYDEPYQLMIAARLSAQCTDARVNIVTKTLFKKYPTLQSFADADLAELEQDIKPCGFYHLKAKSIIEACQRLQNVYHGVVPDTLEDLLTLSGIGRKTANLLMGDVHHKPAVVTDTHFIRITGKLGLTRETAPPKVEADLKKLLPPEESSAFCHRIVQFGRDVCRARSPKCSICPLSEICTAKAIDKTGKIG
ncbi:MAG: endonuclease III [Oscillospiraceae bacterium]|nr:endonuclease III [Oscillospiraceae bacterium]